MTSERGVAVFRISAHSVISTMNVERPVRVKEESMKVLVERNGREGERTSSDFVACAHASADGVEEGGLARIGGDVAPDLGGQKMVRSLDTERDFATSELT